jgi:hypothetical protein
MMQATKQDAAVFCLTFGGGGGELLRVDTFTAERYSPHQTTRLDAYVMLLAGQHPQAAELVPCCCAEV